ncbi:MAG: hypothetical protein ACLQDY_09940 [Streptosporangiaceae bacterium]
MSGRTRENPALPRPTVPPPRPPRRPRPEPAEHKPGAAAPAGPEPDGPERNGPEPGGAEHGGTEHGGAEHGGAELGGAELGGAAAGGAAVGGPEPGGPEPGEPGQSGRRPRSWLRRLASAILAVLRWPVAAGRRIARLRPGGSWLLRPLRPLRRLPLSPQPRLPRLRPGRLRPGRLRLRRLRADWDGDGAGTGGATGRKRLGRGRLGRGRLRRGRLRRLRIGQPGRLRPATLAAAAAWLVTGLALFTCYLHVSRTLPVNSDGAANALQAWDMLHGNPLLRGWQLSDVSFYTTELPQYMLIEVLRGLTPDVVHVAAAMTYTLVALLAAALAKGQATGRAAAARMLITAGIMLAPQPGIASYVLLLSPDHVGSCVPVLTALLLLDRARRRWYAPAAVGIILAWALIADNIVMITGIVPLIAVALWRAYQRSFAGRPRPATGWFELWLATCALLAVWAGTRAQADLRSAGGFAVWPVGHVLAVFSQLPHNLMLTIQGLLLLFGADFFGQTLGISSGLTILHLAGLGLAAWGFAAAVRRFPRADLVSQVLAVAVAASLAGYLFGQRAIDPQSTREFAAVLPLGAVLAGRLLGSRLQRARLLPALGLIAIAYGASMGRAVAQPSVPPANEQLAGWLAAHHLDHGLAGYWVANSVTLDTGGAITLRPVVALGHAMSRSTWEADARWFRPGAPAASFVVLTPPGPAVPPYPWITSVRAAFGQPARIYYTGSYTILVWDKNLLPELTPPPDSTASDSSAGTSSAP